MTIAHMAIVLCIFTRRVKKRMKNIMQFVKQVIINLYFFLMNWQQRILSFIKNFLLDTCPFVGPLTPFFIILVTSPLGFKARMGSLIHTWQRCTWYTFPQIHLWCDTFAGVYGQYMWPRMCFSTGRLSGFEPQQRILTYRRYSHNNWNSR